MIRLNVGGRELALAFTLGAMDKIEERIGQAVDINNVRATVVEQTTDRKKLVEILAILAEEGEAIEGRDDGVDKAWVLRHLRPGMLPRAQIAILGAVAEGMSMESAEGEDDQEIDAVLEEIRKKAAPRGLQHE